MVERQRPTSAQEASPLHEQGGLTTGHWKEILSQIDGAYNEEARTVKRFATEIGLHPTMLKQYGHEERLGRRHWNFIAGLNAKKRLREPRRILFILPDRITTVDSEIMLEVQEFAVQEENAIYTLNDHVGRGLPNVIEYMHVDEWPDEYELTADGIWVHNCRIPYIYEKWTKMDHDSGHYFPAADGELVTVYSYQGVREKLEASELYKRWLLSENEITFTDDKFPRHVSASSLREQLFELAKSNPDEAKRRLKEATPQYAHLHDSPHFGILEKPIPASL